MQASASSCWGLGGICQGSSPWSSPTGPSGWGRQFPAHQKYPPMISNGMEDIALGIVGCDCSVGAETVSYTQGPAATIFWEILLDFLFFGEVGDLTSWQRGASLLCMLWIMLLAKVILMLPCTGMWGDMSTSLSVVGLLWGRGIPPIMK